MNDKVQSIINEVCNKRIGIGQTDNDKWWLHQMWIAQHKIADYLMNNDLQQRIDKAIEYIENHLLYEIDLEDEDMDGNYQYTYKAWNDKDLLEILKGEDNDNSNDHI